MEINFQPNDALLIVDVQNDFFPGGALGVPEGDHIIPLANELIEKAIAANILIICSRDWHPADHCSFRENGGIWPVHCVKNSDGAKFHQDITMPADVRVIDKAFEQAIEAYSAFEGQTHDAGEPLPDVLEQQNIKRIWIVGLALDYCVKATALDAIKAGFQTHVILEGTRIIDESQKENVLQEMRNSGVEID